MNALVADDTVMMSPVRNDMMGISAIIVPPLYNATLPQERDFVLEGLQDTLNKFESPSITAGYIRQGIERLQTLARRFSGTVKETTIAAAKTALMEFGKKHFAQALEHIFRWML